jgi:hypothetical protein
VLKREMAAARTALASRWRAGLVVGGLTLVVAVPLLVALGVLQDPPWLPLSDVAQIEMRVRDVGLEHPPLVGVTGRFRGQGTAGFHPGPLAFYALAPVYRLLGSDGGALLASATLLNIVGVGAAVGLAQRRGGWRLAAAVAALLALLIRAYGTWRLVDPWNPHLVVVWWLVFLLAVWSVLCDDWPAGVVAVGAGSFCAQAHISYVALVPGLLAVATVWFVVRRRQQRGLPEAAAAWRRQRNWSAAAAGAFVVLWVPPLVDQVVHHPGNLSVLIDNFGSPDDPRVPFGDAFRIWARHLDVTALWRANDFPDGYQPAGSAGVGLACLGMWALAAGAWAWRRRPGPLLRLHLVVGVAQALGLLAISRIVGRPWPYLTVWAWGTAALMAFATGWTVLAGVSSPADAETKADADASVDGADGDRHRPAPSRRIRVEGRPAWSRAGAAALGVTLVASAGMLAANAARTELPWQDMAPPLITISHATLAALDDDPAGCGDDCRYLLTWSDAYYNGTHAYGLLVELERRGYDVNALPALEDSVRSHRLLRPENADAVIHLAVGQDAIADARRRPGAEELAIVDPNSPAAQEAHAELTRDLLELLRDEGFDRHAEQVAEGRGVVPPDGMSEELTATLFMWALYEQSIAAFLIPP